LLGLAALNLTKNPYLLGVNSVIAPRRWPPASLYRLNPFRRALLDLDFMPDEILPSPSRGSPCILAVVRFFRQICLAIPSPPTYFNKLLIKRTTAQLQNDPIHGVVLLLCRGPVLVSVPSGKSPNLSSPPIFLGSLSVLPVLKYKMMLALKAKD